MNADDDIGDADQQLARSSPVGWVCASQVLLAAQLINVGIA